MSESLKIYNTLTREKEVFKPLAPPHVGLYVCGPTVYNYVHLGNCRTFTSFDIVYRYLSHLGYKVRYVRNITDVGHLTGDTDDGEDKIAKKARLENLEPMEIVQRYTIDFHTVMKKLNNFEPSIEPTATGHLLEQIALVKEIIAEGFAYESNGSVYFDVKKYNEKYQYGKLSGRVLEELLASAERENLRRELQGQEEKRSQEDFALWKKAEPEHIMQWESPWGMGFPGWHLECSAMSTKYLGKKFDIHGGGLDLKFPHHECEIAQSVGSTGEEPVNYWMHANMLTINGQKMSKSLNNSILPVELFAGTHPLLEEAYSPMTLRFCMLQTHYRSTMDLSNDSLKASRKGYKKVINGLRIAKQLAYPETTENQIDPKQIEQIGLIISQLYEGMNDDFNTAKTLAALFELVKKINSLDGGQIQSESLGKEMFDKLLKTYIVFVEDILGLFEEEPADQKRLVESLMQIYKEAKQHKNYSQVDQIRANLKNLGIVVKDMKHKIDWAYEE